MSCSSTNFWTMLQSHILCTSTIFFFHRLSKVMTNSLIDLNFRVYQFLNHELSNSFVFSPIHLASTISIDSNVRVFIFYVSYIILFSWNNFFSHTRSWWFGDPSLFFYCIQTVMWRSLLIWHCTYAIKHVDSRK